MAKKKTYVKLLLAAFLLCAIERFCHSQTEGFSVHRITSARTTKATWAPPALKEGEKESLAAILNQPFTYLGKGAQSFAFASADGRYVLKLLRQERLRPTPFALKEAQRRKKASKRGRIIESCQLAFEEMKEETGLLYIHLNSAKTSPLPCATIIDKLGIRHQLDLSQSEFILQERAELVYPTLERLIREDKIQEAKKALDELIALILKRQSRGIFDKDPDFKSNFGFTTKGAIQLDFGRFRRGSSPPGELREITQKLRHDLRELFPPLADFIERRISDEEKRCAG
jgi:hypothetical protein